MTSQFGLSLHLERSNPQTPKPLFSGGACRGIQVSRGRGGQIKATPTPGTGAAQRRNVAPFKAEQEDQRPGKRGSSPPTPEPLPGSPPRSWLPWVPGWGFLGTHPGLEMRDKKMLKTHPVLMGFPACWGRWAPLPLRIIQLTRHLDEGN